MIEALFCDGCHKFAAASCGNLLNQVFPIRHSAKVGSHPHLQAIAFEARGVKFRTTVGVGGVMQQSSEVRLGFPRREPSLAGASSTLARLR